MKHQLALLITAVVVVAGIAAAVAIPAPKPAPQQITLPDSRMVTCPIGDAGMGTTAISVADQQEFTTALVGGTASAPATTASFDNPAQPVIVRGSATVSGVSTYTEDNQTMAVPCTPPITSGTWNGIDTKDYSATLFLTDVDASSAVVDVFLYSETGPLPGMSDITVTSGAPQMLALDQIAPSDTPISVQIRTSRGRVAAQLRLIASQGSGVDWQLPQISPSTNLVMAGIPAGDGTRTLSVTNTSSTAIANVQFQIFGASGPITPLGQNSVQVMANQTRSIDITQALAGQASAVALTSDQPVTATVTADGPDMTGISGQQPLNGGIVMPAIGGTLWVANSGTTETSVTVSQDDGNGSLQTKQLSIPAQATVSESFPSTGAPVFIASDSPDVYASLALTDTTWSILPLSGGSATATVPVPGLDPGLG